MIRPLPKDTNRAANEALDGCKNLGLILDKFQPWQKVPGRHDTPPDWNLGLAAELWRQRRWQAGFVKGGEARGRWFTGVSDDRVKLREPALKPNDRIEKKVVAPFIERWLLMVDAAGAEPFDLWTETPLIIGLGAKGTLEAGLTLHPLYGFPYVPGSALKGLARAAAFFDLAERLGLAGADNETFLQGNETPLQELSKALDEKEQKDWPSYLRRAADDIQRQAQEFRQLFGWRGGIGEAIFFDAPPALVPQLTTEILTPHFFDYYSEDGTLPQDNQDPKPNSFLAVAARTPFWFAIAARRGSVKVHERAEQWLRRGLLELGLGGKTASGYGFFVEVEPGKRPRPIRVKVESPEPNLTGYRPESGPGQPSAPPTPPPPPPPPPRHGPGLGDEVMNLWARRDKEDE